MELKRRASRTRTSSIDLILDDSIFIFREPMTCGAFEPPSLALRFRVLLRRGRVPGLAVILEN